MGNIEIFERIAYQYDTEKRIEVAKICSDVIRTNIQQGNTKEKALVDFGCGTGLVGMEFLEDFKTVLFIDSAQKMTEVVEQKIEQLQTENATTLCLNLEEESVRDIRGDYIFIVQTLLHIKDTEFILKQLFQMLNPNGHLIIIDFDKNPTIVSQDVHNGFDQNDLKRTMEKVGFSKVQSALFYHGEKLFMNEDAALFIMDGEKE
ncbi:ubiquinone/menaquinone biosynthesis C-methylase UbiE [Aequitasia blattaphilus]|uniref:Methyltransferase domain-containing protein n=1 Tax=Aequitasia blattaphilus TaxID=2949332 RepID=A0ABT1E7J6_9FIRM|nr:methyltransferase [Aequitasia blattaphilus]MCP1100952.1 methyltransferase domain-containing protein [Aequitasia blattaphilus]MCR8613592.1 methyltransferase domain-containing protein [Aequitasia blattaphilus]